MGTNVAPILANNYALMLANKHHKMIPNLHILSCWKRFLDDGFGIFDGPIDDGFGIFDGPKIEA